MAYPRQEGELRVPLTADERATIHAAAEREHLRDATWARQVLLKAAGASQPRKRRGRPSPVWALALAGALAALVASPAVAFRVPRNIGFPSEQIVAKISPVVLARSRHFFALRSAKRKLVIEERSRENEVVAPGNGGDPLPFFGGSPFRPIVIPKQPGSPDRRTAKDEGRDSTGTPFQLSAGG